MSLFVECHNQFRDAQTLRASRVVIYDKHGNPIVLAFVQEEHDDEQLVVMAHCNDPDFASLLHELGVQYTATVVKIKE